MTTLTLTKGYALGLFFIFLVALIFAAASILTKDLYKAHKFHSPFILTYIGVSLFTLWLPLKMASNAATNMCCNGEDQVRDSSIDDITVVDLPFQGDNDDDDHIKKTEKQQQSLTPYKQMSDHDNSAAPKLELESQTPIKQKKVNEMPPAYHMKALNHSVLDEDFQEKPIPEVDDPKNRVWTHEDHFVAAVKIAPVWFFANWSYYASLGYTSITSSTVLTSTGSLFAFLFAILSKDEKFNWIKLAGVLLGFAGCLVTTLSDAKAHKVEDCSHHHCTSPALIGDILGLMGAAGYGAYAVQTRVLCPHDETLFSMQILLGYIGLVCTVFLFPFVMWSVLDGLSLTFSVFFTLVTVGFFDNVLFDYLWLRAVMLTNATVAAVGLGLTIPMAIATDLFLEQETVSTGAALGAITVLFGFVFVNLGNEDLRTEEHPKQPDEFMQCDNPFDSNPPYAPSETYSEHSVHDLDGFVVPDQREQQQNHVQQEQQATQELQNLTRTSSQSSMASTESAAMRKQRLRDLCNATPTTPGLNAIHQPLVEAGGMVSVATVTMQPAITTMSNAPSDEVAANAGTAATNNSTTTFGSNEAAVLAAALDSYVMVQPNNNNKSNNQDDTTNCV